MRRLFVMVLLVAVLAPFFRSVPSLAQEPLPAISGPVERGVLPGSFMGMVVRDPYYEWQTNASDPSGTNRAFFETMGANLRAAGAKWVRIEMFSEECYPNVACATPGQVATEKYSYFINTVAPKYGLKVIALLATPLVRQRADADPSRYPGTDYAPGSYINPEKIEDQLSIVPSVGSTDFDLGRLNGWMRIWLENAFAVAKAFPYDPTTGSGIAAFEVLNEPNRYINGGGKGLKPEFVAILLTKFYRVYHERCAAGAIGGYCNDVKIILGGLHPGRCDDCNLATDRQYLDKIYKSADSFGTYLRETGKYPLDGVAYHPYPLEMRAGLLPELTGSAEVGRVAERVISLRRVMLANGDGANKLWITEIGDRGAPADADNQARQAQFFKSIYWTLWRQRWYIETVLWFKYEDFAVPRSDADNGAENWGVVRLMRRPLEQVCPQQLPADRQTCEYEQSGTVQIPKQVLADYTAMSTTGAGLDVYRILMPVVGK